MTNQKKILFVLALVAIFAVPAKAQRVSDIRLRLAEQLNGPLVMDVPDPLTDNHQIDSFSITAPGTYQLKLQNCNTSRIGTIRNKDFGLDLFISPGVPVDLVIGKKDGTVFITGTGAGKIYDSLYKNFKRGSYADFIDRYSKATMAARPMVLSDLLRQADAITVRQVKEYFFYIAMKLVVDSSAGILALNDHKLVYQNYYSGFGEPLFKKEIDRRYNQKLSHFIAKQGGQPAPSFNLADPSGRSHTLESYRGKVVYLDLWASWCAPCRLESPYLQKLANRYGAGSSVAFIGIAVGDNPANWKKALREDKPGWLQLIDKHSLVANAYAASSVPRYVLIDKKGNIAAFDAPPPTDPEKLVALIDKVLADPN